jgi:hypothetical protein
MKFSKSALLIFMMLCLSLSSCGNLPSTSTASTNDSSKVTVQSEVDGQEVIQEFDIDNCGGKAEITRNESRSFSVDVAISTELAAKIGASAEVVSAEIQATIGTALGIGVGRVTSIEVKAPPDTHIYFQLAWIGKSRIGIVQNVKGSDVPIAFQSFTPNDVRIKDQHDVGCQKNETDPIVELQDDTKSLPTTVATQSFCPSITSEQIENLKNIQGVSEAISQAEKYAGYHQTDYQEGEVLPANVLIATNLFSLDFDQMGIIPINNQGGWGLFLTTSELTATKPGTYWCVK